MAFVFVINILYLTLSSVSAVRIAHQTTIDGCCNDIVPGESGYRNLGERREMCDGEPPGHFFDVCLVALWTDSARSVIMMR